MISVMVEEDEMFISHDVVSLFTNTPVDLALQIIREWVEGDTELHTRMRLTVEDIMDLLKLIVTTTYFSSGASYTNRCSVLLWGAQFPHF